MHVPCQTPKRARIGKFADESGRSAPALERFAPFEAGGWSKSPQWVARFASLPKGGWSDSPHPPRPLGSPPRLTRPHRPCRFLKTRQRFAGMGHGVFQKTAARLRPHPRISIFGHACVERNHVVSLRRGRRDCDRPCRGQPKNLGKNRPTHAELPVRGLGAAAESFGGGAHMPPPAKNRVGFRGHTRGRKPVGLCGRSVRSSPPPPGSATRLDHREDACSDRRGQARPCLDHLSQSRVCCCGCGHLCGHFRGIAAIPGRNRLRLRIANPPSSVRLRPEPLIRRPSRCPGNPGLRGGFFVFRNECLRIARLGI